MMKLPKGFRAAAGVAGIKASGRPDVGIIYSDEPLHWALMSTENQVKAPFIYRNRSRFISKQPVHGVVVNSGNANCATGERGVWDNEDFARVAASALGVARVQDILTASTGIVGHHLPVDKLRTAVPQIAKGLTEDGEGFAQAILTTDLVIKQVGANLPGGARVVGIAKGSGMIHPNMATMLAFVMTDAVISQDALRELWPQVVTQTFNQVTVDGDTSPNDTAIVFSSNRVRADEATLAEALVAVCEKLAQKIARDGEGATKLMTVNVTGARSPQEARAAARAIARSPLVKSAAHGNDPNWGRILIAAGSSGAISDLANVRISLQGTTVYQGTPQPFKADALSAQMNAPDLVIDIDLAAGQATATAWGCDLTADYVKINADYHT